MIVLQWQTKVYMWKPFMQRSHVKLQDREESIQEVSQ